MAFNNGGGGAGVGACWERNMFVPPREDPKITFEIRRHTSRRSPSADGTKDTKESKEVCASRPAESWVATFTLVDEDDTTGQLLRHELGSDTRVSGAGYHKPHPLENLMKFHVQSHIDCPPQTALNDAIDRCVAKLSHLRALCPPLATAKP